MVLKQKKILKNTTQKLGEIYKYNIMFFVQFIILTGVNNNLDIYFNNPRNKFIK